MTDLADRLVIKDGNVFAVVPRDGDWSGADGVWMDDCRHVSRHELRIDGARRGAATPTTTPATRPSTATRAARGSSAACTPTARWSSASSRRARSSSSDGGRLRHDLRAARDRAARAARTGTAPSCAATRRRASCAWSTASPRARRRRRRAPSCAPRVECDDERFGTVLRRAFADLRMLLSSLDGEPYFAAGVPWYATLFGRDSLIAAMQLMPFAPDGRRGNAAPARRAHRPRARPDARGGAGQGPPRAASGRDGHAARALLRQHRRDAAVPARVGGDGGRRTAGQAAPGGRGRTRVDRAPRSADVHGGRAAPPGLEGLRGRRARRASRRADRAAGVRGARRRAVLAGAPRLLRDGARHRRARIQPGPRAVGHDASRRRARGRSATRSWVRRCSRAGASARSPPTSRSTTR